MLRILDRLEEILIASLLAAATLLVFVAVVHRYGTGIPQLYPYLIGFHISWAQELSIYMIIWVAKFGAAYGVRTGIHVGVDVVVNMLIGLYPTDQTSPDLEIPSWIVYLCIPLGSYLMCFRFLQVAWTFWRTGALPHHDPGQVEGVDKDAVAKELA